MPEVTIKINNRGYSLACDEGQEQRLIDLGHYVDSRLKDIASAGAATNEAHLLVLTSLVLGDEIYELQDEVTRLKGIAKNTQNQQYSPQVPHEEETLIVEAIDHLAGKIEHIASRIQGAETEAA